MNRFSAILAIFAILISIFSFWYLNFYSAQEFAYVDVNKLLEGYNRTKVEKDKFDNKANKLKSNLDTLVQDWQAEIQKFEKERSGLSKRELDLRKELLTTKQQQLNSYQQAIQDQIQKEENTFKSSVIQDINVYVKKFGDNNQYNIIFGASGSGNIMYADESVDLTEQVLEGLNSSYNND